MAKLAQVTYGLGGKGEAYTYVVNDNVRAGQVINPIVKHYKSGNTFATTGIIQEAVERNSTTGQSLEDGVKDKTGNDLAKSETASALGISSRIRGEKGRFAGSYSQTGGTGKITQDGTTGRYSAQHPENFHRNPYQEAQMGANLQYATTPIAETETQQKAQETFWSMSKKFMPKD